MGQRQRLPGRISEEKEEEECRGRGGREGWEGRSGLDTYGKNNLIIKNRNSEMGRILSWKTTGDEPLRQYPAKLNSGDRVCSYVFVLVMLQPPHTEVHFHTYHNFHTIH